MQSGIGEIAGGPDEIHLAIKDVLATDGTLFMYAGCPQYVDEVSRGNLSAEEEAEVLENLPAFDAETARCDRSHGALAEFFRTYPGNARQSSRRALRRVGVAGREVPRLRRQQSAPIWTTSPSCITPST